MKPLFKTDRSIGKSLLTPDDVARIATKDGLTEVVLVEDNFHGFLESRKIFDESNLKFTFCLRLNIYEEKESKQTHKVVIIALNDEGCKALYKIHTEAFCENEGKLKLEDLVKHWSENLGMAIPFYDSFLYYNNFTFASFAPDLKPFKPQFLVEDNGLPFDGLLKNSILEYTKGKYNIEKVKTIYYEKAEDFEVFQTFKITCGEYKGRAKDLSSPGLEHFCSDKFSFEAWKNER